MFRVYSLSLVFLLIDVAVIVSTQNTDCLLTSIPDRTGITPRLQGLVNSAPETVGTVVVTITNGPFYACQVQGTIKGTVQELSAIVQYTLDSDSATLRTRQFELQCQGGVVIADNGWDAVTGSLTTPTFSYGSIDFLQLQNCSSCDRNAGNDDQHCVACNTDCNVGLMRCFGSASSQCCVAFEDDTDETCRRDLDCNKNNFVANEQNDFTCACGLNSTLCDPGYEFTNDTDCSCVLSNICLTQPPPCENGGSCILNSAPDSFTCNCATGFMGTNCSEEIPAPSSSSAVMEVPSVVSSTEMTSTSTSTSTTTTSPSTTIQNTMMSTESSDNVVPTATTLTEESTTFLPAIIVSVIVGFLLIIVLIILIIYIIYYFASGKGFAVAKTKANAPFADGESHNNPLYLKPDEVTSEVATLYQP